MGTRSFDPILNIFFGYAQTFDHGVGVDSFKAKKNNGDVIGKRDGYLIHYLIIKFEVKQREGLLWI